MNEIIRVLMDRDGFDYNEAVEAIHEARIAVHDGLSPERALDEYFGLEADHILDLI